MVKKGDDSTRNISWHKIVLKYAYPDIRKSIWQIVNSFVPYIISWLLMYKSLEYSYLITLLLAIPASGFLIRLFIIFHDCGHGSFFRSRKANNLTGVIFGVLTFTPYFAWTSQHAIHHATAGNLDKRGTGDITTLTVDEYLHSTGWQKFYYRGLRNPFILFTIGPLFLIFITNRFTTRQMKRREKINIYLTNFALLALAAVLSLMIGIRSFLMIQLPIIFISQSIGIWLFYIQHQYEGVIWERKESWDYLKAALSSCSFLKLPRILQWFTGNIGFHHVHHLGPGIPNYKLESCNRENDIFRSVKPVLPASTFRYLFLSLWDEKRRKLVGFNEIAL
jgi:omega-6 fatty acid desaturase (delta-12 desaturase)